MKNNLKFIFTLPIIAAMFVGCVNDTYDTPPPTEFDCVIPGVSKTKEVSAMYAAATTTTAIYHNIVGGVEVPDYLEAIVVSSDEGGNFYKNMYLQPTDGSKGFNLSLNEGNVYVKGFEPGRRVFLKLNGLAYANPTNFASGLIFGAPPTEIFAVDRLSALEYKNYLIPTCTIVNEDDIVQHITLAQANSDTYLNKLVEFDGVQFSDEAISGSGTYDSNRLDESDASITITNGTNSIILRTSRFANFAGNKVPVGKGKIRGVLTKYSGTYQLTIRTERDVEFTQPRIDLTAPLGGSNLQYNGAFTENFETGYTVGQTSFPKYINDPLVSSRYWALKTFSSNEYIEMSSFAGNGNPGVPARSFFFVPVNFTAANTFTFKEEVRFNQGVALKVYYVTSANYTPGGTLDPSTFTNITSSFNITYPSIGQSENAFNSAGTYNIPASLTGNGFFVFEYAGSTTVTTTIQIDDITVN